MIWHGWADPHISPLNSIAYYEAMQHTLGEQRVKKFARLYLFPGGYHCGGGEGPFNMDLLTPVMQWVESGIAPNKIVATHTKGSAGLPDLHRAVVLPVRQTDLPRAEATVRPQGCLQGLARP
jgi:feruloyl esterase